MKESQLYAPVKALMQTQGYEVKAEIKGCDLVAIKPDSPTVIVELKLSFSIELVLQGVDRLSLSDDVYLAVGIADSVIKRRNWRNKQADYKKLCRRLGLGLMSVRLEKEEGEQVQVLLDPAPYNPRKNKQRQTRLVKEFTTRIGDPNTGGVNKKTIVTAYRQDAIKCAQVLSTNAPMTLKGLRAQSKVEKAGNILQNNYYGWFERVSRGVYCLTDKGYSDLKLNADLAGSLVREVANKSPDVPCG